MKRILIVGSGASWSLESLYRRAFIQAGVTSVDLLDIRKMQVAFPRTLPGRIASRVAAPWNVYQLRSGLTKLLRNHPNGFDIIIIFKGFELSRDTLEHCRSLSGSAQWVNINPDNPFDRTLSASTNSNVFESISFFDLYCTWSRALVTRLSEQGARAVHYLPFGYDPEMHAAAESAARVDNQRVLFVGTWDPWREQQLSELSEFELRIYGHDWDRVARSSPLYAKIMRRPVYHDELAREAAASAVSLNLLRKQNTGSHNMRTFEIPALGGLMLTTRSQEQQEFFPEGEASLMFGDTAELKEQIRRVLADPAKANEIRAQGKIKVLPHTYCTRAKSLLAALSRETTLVL